MDERPHLHLQAADGAVDEGERLAQFVVQAGKNEKTLLQGGW